MRNLWMLFLLIEQLVEQFFISITFFKGCFFVNKLDAKH